MEEMVYTFSCVSNYSAFGIKSAVEKLKTHEKIIFLCVGSDLIVGDCLGPLCGTLAKNKTENAYIYGTLENPLTAKEIKQVGAYIKKMHPDCCVVAVDASVGTPNEVGMIKVFNGGIKPGLGVNKDLPMIGDVSIVGVVAEKTFNNYPLYNFTRLNLIYKMSDIISESIKQISKENKGARFLHKKAL